MAEGTDETLPSNEPVEGTIGSTQTSGDGPATGTATGSTESLDALTSYTPSQFALGAEIGRGGLGRVMRARDPIFDRPIAIKELLSNQADARARFLREAMITARLQHPAIVPIYLAGVWPDGAPFYAMKLVEGRPLYQVMRECKTLAERIARLPSVIAACEAIAFAHRAGIIHRDLKPQNILIGELGETVVIDWGLAKDLAVADEPARAPRGGYRDAVTATETIEGAVMGTPAYLAPEGVAGNELDKRGDVYSLGALLYELLAGAMPYSGARDVSELLAKVASGPPITVASLAPDAPRDLVAIVERAMARERDDRYADAGALVGDLKRFEAGQLVSVREYGRAERFARWLKRHRTAVTVAGIAALVLVVMTVIGMVRIVGARDEARASAEREGVARRDAEADRTAAIARGDQLQLERAALLVQSDPTAAIAALANLTPGSPVWALARPVVAEAGERGIATLLPAPGVNNDELHLDDTDTLLVATGVDRSVAYTIADGRGRAFVTPGEPFGLVGSAVLSLRKRGHSLWLTDARTGRRREFVAADDLEDPIASPDGRWIAATTGAGAVVWPTGGGASRTIPDITAIAIANTGTVIGKHEQDIVIVDGDRRRRIASPVEPSEVTVAPDAATLAVVDSTGKAVVVLDVATSRWTKLPLPAQAFDLVFEGPAILRALADTAVIEWRRAPTGAWSAAIVLERLVRGARDQPAWLATSVGFRARGARSWRRLELPTRLTTRDGTTTFALMPDGTLRRWSLVGRNADRCELPGVLAVVHGSTRVVQNTATTDLVVCDLRDGTRKSLVGSPMRVQWAFTSSDGRWLATIAIDEHNVRPAMLWDLSTFTGRSLGLMRPEVFVGGRLLGERDDKITSIDTATGVETARCPQLPEGRYTFGDRLVAVQSRQGLAVCDLESGVTTMLDPARGRFDDVALGHADKLLVTVAGTRVTYWDLATRTPRLATLPEPAGNVQIAPDGSQVIVTAQETVYVLDAAATVVTRIPMPRRLAERGGLSRQWATSSIVASPDLRQLVVAVSGRDVFVHDVAANRSRSIAGTSNTMYGFNFAAGGLVMWPMDHRPFFVADNLPADARALAAWVRAATTTTLGTDNSTLVSPPLDDAFGGPAP